MHVNRNIPPLMLRHTDGHERIHNSKLNTSFGISQYRANKLHEPNYPAVVVAYRVARSNYQADMQREWPHPELFLAHSYIHHSHFYEYIYSCYHECRLHKINYAYLQRKSSSYGSF